MDCNPAQASLHVDEAVRSRISVVLPNYNHAAFLDAALQALAGQTPPPAEIIVVDDGSTDDSLAILAAAARKIPQLRLIRHDANVGPIAALNTGLNAAQGEFVYFAAADDLVLPGLFAHTLPMLIAHPDAALCCAECLVTDQTGLPIGLRPVTRPSQVPACFSPMETIRLLASTDNWILTGSALFRRKPLMAAGGFDAELSSLADGFVARQLAARHGFCFVPQVLVNWRISVAGVSRTTTRDLALARSAMARARSLILSDPVLPAWYADVFERRWRFALGRLALDARPFDRNILLEFAATQPVDRFVLKTICALPHLIGKYLGLFWLTVRLRPTSLMALMRTATARRAVTSGLAPQSTGAKG